MKMITIQPRDKSVSYPPRGNDNTRGDLVMRALSHGLRRYKKAMSDLAKM